MRYLLLSDIHANLEALDAVLASASAHGADRILCLGDVVGYGPDPNACAARLLHAGITTLAGNHDLAAIGGEDLSRFNALARAALVWTAAHLEPETREFLRTLPARLHEPAFLAVHGSPRDPAAEYVVTTTVARRNFEAETFDLCFVGHTHIPAAFVLDEIGVRRVDVEPGVPLTVPGGARAIVNVGSVGQPRDGDPRAAYVVFDAASREIVLHRVPYPVERTQAKMAAAGLPQPLIARLSVGM